MKWEELIKAVIIAALSVSGGSYVTHSIETTQHKQVLEDGRMSCSEVIQLVISNQ